MSSTAKHMILIDMDGTITPPRKHIEPDMLSSLLDLCYSADISIVSGSDIDYVMEQCGNKFIAAGMSRRITLMPCNGTKVYRDNRNDLYQKMYSVSMKEQLGDILYRKIVAAIFKVQAMIINDLDIPVSGRYLSYRDSTINWSMIGRDATPEERRNFSNRIDRDAIRKDAIYMFGAYSDLSFEELNSIEMVLGGETSIDVYPSGWDKTYSLRHTKGYNSWFIGDKCKPGQNDYHLYEELNKYKRAFSSSGPQDTIQIINEIINRIKSERDLD